jgi:hypothetical protein
MKFQRFSAGVVVLATMMLAGCPGSNPATVTQTPAPSPTPTAEPTEEPQITFTPAPFLGFPDSALLTGRLTYGANKAPTDVWPVRYRTYAPSGALGNELALTDGNGYFHFTRLTPDVTDYQFVLAASQDAFEAKNLYYSFYSDKVEAKATGDKMTPMSSIDLDWDGAKVKPAIGSTIDYTNPVTFEWPVPAAMPDATYSVMISYQSARSTAIWRAPDLSEPKVVWDGKVALGTKAGEAAAEDIFVQITYGKPGGKVASSATDPFGVSRSIAFKRKTDAVAAYRTYSEHILPVSNHATCLTCHGSGKMMPLAGLGTYSYDKGKASKILSMAQNATYGAGVTEGQKADLAAWIAAGTPDNPTKF